MVGPHAVIHARTVVGTNCQIEAGAVLGGAGFGFATTDDGEHVRMPQLGRVILGANVEVGARTTIDRGALSNTLVGEGTKIDDCAYVAHNVVIAPKCLVMAGCVICGGAQLGERAIVSPGAVIRENVRIGARAHIGLGSVVTKDVPAGVTVAGVPAAPIAKRR